MEYLLSSALAIISCAILLIFQLGMRSFSHVNLTKKPKTYYAVGPELSITGISLFLIITSLRLKYLNIIPWLEKGQLLQYSSFILLIVLLCLVVLALYAALCLQKLNQRRCSNTTLYTRLSNLLGLLTVGICALLVIGGRF